MQMFYSREKVLLAACIALAVFQMCAVAEEKSNRLTASDVFNLQYAVDPQISPDGRRIVYVREFSDMLSDRRCSNLWVINFDGTDNRPLTTGTHSDTSPRWSPDGNRIAFLSDQDGRFLAGISNMGEQRSALVPQSGRPTGNTSLPLLIGARTTSTSRSIRKFMNFLPRTAAPRL